MSRERRLGRGLEALLGRAGIEAPAAVAPLAGGQATAAAAAVAPRRADPGDAGARLVLHKPEEVEQAASGLPTDEIEAARIDANPWQPRSTVHDADLADLAKSLEEHGLVQPIVVRAKGDRYQLVVGQRRLLAARRLGWTTVLARVLDIDDRQMAEIAIVENLQRRDLDPLEKAASFKQYLASWGCTQEELAKRLSVDRSTVANLIRLLELPPAVRARLQAGAISMGHARALLPLGDEDAQARLADRIVAEGLSVRAIEAEVAEILRADEVAYAAEEGAEEAGAADGDEAGEAGEGTGAGDGDRPATAATKRKPGRPATRRSSQTVAVENDLRKALGVKVVVHANGRGAGRIVIPFGDLDEFQRLYDHLCG